MSNISPNTYALTIALFNRPSRNEGPPSDGSKGAYDHTFDRMVNRTGAKIAAEIYTLYEKLGEYLRDQNLQS